MSSQRYTLSKKAFICTANIYIVLKLLRNKWGFIIKNKLFISFCHQQHAVHLMSSFSSWSNFIFTGEKKNQPYCILFLNISFYHCLEMFIAASQAWGRFSYWLLDFAQYNILPLILILIIRSNWRQNIPWMEKDNKIRHDLSKKCHTTGTFPEMYASTASKCIVQY